MSENDHDILPPQTQALLEELLSGFMACRYRPSELVSRYAMGRGARNALFYCLGYLAKADGRVTESDIRFAQHLMTGLALSPRQRRKAIRRFHQGRDTASLSTLKLASFRLMGPWSRRTSLLMGLCFCHCAQLFGQPDKPRRYRCEDAFYQLGLPLAAMDRMFRLYRQEVWTSAPPPKPETLQEAHDILGVQAGDSFIHIKRRYRKEVSRYHPDKLGNDLTESEQARARDQLLRLQQAWDVIKRRERLSR